MELKIQVLYLPECPNYLPALDAVRQAIAAEHVSAQIESIEVPDTVAAESLGFLGSASVGVNGRDIDPGIDQTAAIGLYCRTYLTAGRPNGTPSVELIR